MLKPQTGDANRVESGQSRRARKDEPGKIHQRPVPRRRSAGLIALALALLAGTTLGFNYFLSSASDSTPVLVVAQDVARGEVISQSHLDLVELPDSSLQVVAADQLSEVTGQVATADLIPGATLTPNSYATTLAVDDGHAFVGVALDVTQMPAHPLTAGDQVRIVDTPASEAEPPVESPGTISATVLSVTQVEGTGTSVVDLELPGDEAPGLAARAATGRVALIYDGPGQH